MAENDSTTITGKEERNQLSEKLWKIRGLADILLLAARGNDDLPSASVEEVAGTICDIVDEVQEDLCALECGEKHAKVIPLSVELN